MNCIGFAPIARADARVLVLGTLPGRVSLQRGEYYAHQRNAFWPIMGNIFGVPSDQPYPERLASLRDNAIALWDVCARGDRAGSLDAEIEIATAIPNDFGKFFDRHTSIELICFNGGKAKTLFERRVLPTLQLSAQRASRVTLPSTSSGARRHDL